MKKILLVFLAAVMIFSIFACTKKQSDKPAATTEPGTTTGGPDATPGTTQPVTTMDPDKPNLEPKTFKGLEYRVATRDGSIRDEVFADETAVDIRQTALQQRNAIVEDTYDVYITPIPFSDNSLNGVSNKLIDYAFSEEDICDISLTYVGGTGSLVVGGFVVNWYNLKYNDFSKSYWINDVNSNFAFDDALYTVVGDMCITTLLTTYAMFYNRTEGDKIIMEDGSTTMTEEVLEKVGNMEWTMDYFISLVDDIYTDIDDEVGKSAGDFYGFVAEALTNLDIWQFAFDIPMIARDDELGLKSVFNTEKTAIMVDKLNELYWENNGSSIGNSPTNQFKNGNAIFQTTWLERCFTIFKEMEDQYTILPYPMYDDKQDGYKAGVMDNYHVITIPNTCVELEMVSYITEVLNYHSKEILYPVYYEESLQKQFTRDPESIEMLDIIMNGRNFDLATMFPDNSSGLPFLIRWAVGSKNNDFTTYYSKHEEAINKGLKDIVERYEINKSNGENS